MSSPSSGYFYGWNVLGATVLVAFFAFGLGFYGIAVYVAWLQRLHGWSAATVSAPVTVYYVAGAILSAWMAGAYERFGPRLVVTGGALAMALGSPLYYFFAEIILLNLLLVASIRHHRAASRRLARQARLALSEADG